MSLTDVFVDFISRLVVNHTKTITYGAFYDKRTDKNGLRLWIFDFIATSEGSKI